MKKSELQDEFELLEIQLRHLENDYILTKEENEKSTEKYLEILFELKESNQKLLNFQKNLEKIIEEQTKELKESESRYRTLFESSPDGILIADIKTKEFKYANPSICEMLGYSEEELKGMGISDIHPKDSLDYMISKFESQARGEKTLAQDIPCLRKDGKIIYADTNTIRILIDRKECNIGFFRDITKRKEAEKALKESEEQLQEFFENANDLIQSVAPDGRLVFVNRKWRETLGYAEDEIANLTLWDIIHPDSKVKCMETFQRVIAGEEFQNIEAKFVSKSGKTIIVDGNANCRFEGGKPIATRGIFRDITERKRLEEQLQIRQRMDSLGTLVGGIAHDFNNILSGIMGYIDMLNLEADRLTEIQKGYLQNAAKGCDRAADLIRKFQTLSKITLPKKECVDVYEIVKEVFSILKETTDRLIKKKIDLKQGNYYVQADPSEFHQVLMNLGTNAVHAIEERGVKKGDYIRVTAEEYCIKDSHKTELPEGEYIHILFEDNGIGMSDEIRRKAFDPLFTTRKKGKKRGQGLGLAIVYNIITRIHKGYIEIESKEGKGTTFHIYLPKIQPKKEAKVKEVIGIMGGTETILVVDDEEIILNLAETILKKYGYNIKTAIDGEQALKIYKKQKDSIDAVILDLTMPKMSGKMVLERMLEINPDVKVIISSGHSEEDAREGLLSRAKGHIKKPYKLSELAQTVRIVLDL